MGSQSRGKDLKTKSWNRSGTPAETPGNWQRMLTPKLGHCLHTSSTKPNGRHFVIDSGASVHMLSKKDLSSAELQTLKRSRSSLTVVTANGEVQTNEEAQVCSHDLHFSVTVQLLEDTPAVLSLGKLCKEHGCTYSVLPLNRAGTHVFFFWSHFGDRNGVQGRDGCAEEDENPGLSQTSDRPSGSLHLTGRRPRSIKCQTRCLSDFFQSARSTGRMESEWPSGREHHLTKNGNQTLCRTGNFVPLVVPGLL